MPTPQEFMERVVAWPGDNNPGFVNLHWTSPKSPGMRGRPYKNVRDFMDMAQWATMKPSIAKDIYFCLSTQAQAGKMFRNTLTAMRHAKNALLLKAIWIDVDVKPEKGYATIPEALTAIQKFVTDTRMPGPSAVVLSGGGVHVYWISNVALTESEWRPFAEGLKSELLRTGLKCDAGLTTDAARILRVPGTFNYKTTPPKPVRLAALGQSYNFGVDLGFLKDLAPVKSSITATVTSKPVTNFDLSKFTRPAIAFAGLNPRDSLAEGISIHEDLPLIPDAMFKGCPHFADAGLNHGKGHSQGLWMLTMLASTFMEDGRRWAHYFSKGYPTYSKEETDAMYDRKVKEKEERGLGWPSCSAFASEGCKLCVGCMYNGKIKSPLNLAERKQAALPAIAAPVPPPDMELPEGFTVDTETGYICEIMHKTLASGITMDELAPLFMCKLSDPWAQGGTARALHFRTSLDMNNTGAVKVTEEDLATEQQLMKVLRRAGVKPFVPNQRRIAHFLTSWMAKLDAANKRINTVPFGWMFDGADRVGFVYGGRAVKKDGTTVPAGFADEKLEKFYRPTGEPKPWFDALKIITEQRAADIEAIVATSFAAPLMFVPAQYNGIFCAWSNGSGAHKTTSISVGAAVWGNPQLTKENTKSSVKGLMHKLGELKNLPIYWDEIGDDKKMEAVREFLTICTEGRGGTLLHQDRTFRDVEEWQSMVTVGANLSMWDEILKHVHNTDAQLQRVYEFEVIKRPDTRNASDVQRLVDSLNRNYGHMGMAYSDFIGRNPEWTDTFTKQILNSFETDLKARSEERFRMAMAACTFAGAAIANKLGATFNLDILEPFLKEQFLKQRDRIGKATTIGGSEVNTYNTLAQFIKANVENTLWTQNAPISRRGHPGAVVFIAGPSKQHPKPINIRCIVNDRLVQISKARFNEYLTWIKHSPMTVTDGLEKHFGAKINIQRINLATGVGLPGTRETVIEIPVPEGSVLEEFLLTQTPLDQREEISVVANPVKTDIVQSAIQQAANDLALVRQNT